MDAQIKCTSTNRKHILAIVGAINQFGAGALEWVGGDNCMDDAPSDAINDYGMFNELQNRMHCLN